MKNLYILIFIIDIVGCHGLNASTKGDDLSLQQKMDAQPVSNTTSGRQRRARLTTRESKTRASVSTKPVSTQQTNNQASSATSTKPVTKAVATVVAASSSTYHAPVARTLPKGIASISEYDSSAINSNSEPDEACDLPWLIDRVLEIDTKKKNHFLKNHIVETLQSIQETCEMEQHDYAMAGDQEKMDQGIDSALTSPFYFRPIALAPITHHRAAPIRRPTPCFLGLILQNGQFQWPLIPKINSI